MRFVIVTGMSGGGKLSALRLLEDAGFYCVDNLPVPLIEKFVELIAMPGSEVTKVALGLDVRADQPFEDALKILEKLKENGYNFEILFMDASKKVLLKRYKESRRVHPLSSDGSVEDGIAKEKEILKDIKSKSDYVIDTSNLLIRELKEECGLDGVIVRPLAVQYKGGGSAEYSFEVAIPEEQEPITGYDPEETEDDPPLKEVLWMSLDEISEKDRAFLWSYGLISVEDFFKEIKK